MSLAVFNSLMTHTLVLIKRKRNNSGDFVNETTYPQENGFCEYGNKLVTLKTGEKVTSTAIIFLKNDSNIDINHEYWMINQLLPQIRNDMEVLQIDPIDNPIDGLTHHYELIVR